MENEYQENAVVEPVAAENEDFLLTEEAAPVEAAGEPKSKVEQLKKKLLSIPKKIWVIAGAAVLAVVIGLVAWNILSNTYETPIKLYVDFYGAKKVSVDDYVDMLNGFCEDEVEAILKAVKGSDYYEDLVDRLNENREYMVEYFEEEYGSDYKFSYKIEDKEELEKEDLRETRDEFKEMAAELKEILEETEDFDSDDWEDLADELGITKSQAKNLVKAIEALQKELKSVDVTEGYEVTITLTINGEELDEPEEEEETVMVYKINGRWVMADTISEVFSILPIG